VGAQVAEWPGVPTIRELSATCKGHRVAVQNNMADSFEHTFSHSGAYFPMQLDEDIEWRAQTIERTSRVYRAAKRKNEPEMALKHKKKELYAAIEDMFKYVKHLKDTELEKQLRYIEDREPTLRKKRAKAYGDLRKVDSSISNAVHDKQYKRPRE
jgi:hypothetical protein